MFDYILFDLDGTLTDPAEGITNSYIHALKFFGIEIPSYEELCSYIGPPLKDTFRNVYKFDEEKTNLAVKKYREYFADKGLFENKVYDGIESLLKKLKENNKHLLVATSKPENFSIQILEHFGLSKYFDNICGSLMDETRTEKSQVIEYALSLIGNYDINKILMVGDRKHDIIGAHKNKLKCCSVMYGYGSREEFTEYNADFICDTVKDLERICLQ